MLALLFLLALLAPPAAAAPWRPPVDGAVTHRFAYGPDPFARGQHRGADLATRAGARVGAPCTGQVTYAGRVPRHGRGVTVRCGALVATVLDLAATRPRRGSTVLAGSRIGTAAGAAVHLGARRAGDRRAYVDPLALFGGRSRRTRPLGPAPAPAGRRPRPLAAPRVVARPAAMPARRPAATVPPLAWGGLGLIAAAAPATVVRRRRIRRARGALLTSAAR